MALGQDLPDDFYETEWEFNFDRPIGIRFDNLGNAFIFCKPGQIWLVDADGELQTEPLIDISEEVTDWSDHGLVSLALDPDYEENGYIYLYYTLDRHHMLYHGTPEYDPTVDIFNQASMGRITRYTVDYTENDIKADKSSRFVLFGREIGEGNPILMGSHGVGTISFGGDGSLLFSCGEAGSYTEYDIGNAADTFHEQAIEDGLIQDYENVGAFRSMLKTSACGKVMRIDPLTGNGIPNNPFYESENPNSIKSKVWAYGLRNPYKLLHIPGTSEHTDEGDLPGKFFLGDVGSALWEELNLVNKPGEWFGWPKNEGIYSHWAFKNAKLPNPETPNQLFQTECGEEYFLFDDLIRNERADSTYHETYSCEENTTPAPYEYFIHRRPIMCYTNDLWNPPAKTMVPVFDENGAGAGRLLDDPESTVEGDMIEGGSAMPGDICYLANYPEEYLGDLFLIDYHGWINAISIENDEVTEIKQFAKLDKGITDLRFNNVDGKMYYVHFVDGKVRQINFGGIRPPLAKLEVDKFYGASPLTINFVGENSQSFDESQLSYEWDFGDGFTSLEKNPTHTYDIGADINSYEAQLIVRDTSGNMARAKQLISVNNSPPQVEITSIENNQTYSQATTNIFDLEAEVIDFESNDDNLEYFWQVNLHHDEHVHLGPVDNDHETYALIDPTGCNLESFFYRVVLKVEDQQGLVGRDTVDLIPYCGDDFSEFLSLEGVYVEDGINLEWEIDIEEDVTEYIIEYTDDFKFEPIGTVPATGAGDYSFLHDSPALGKNFYRIRAVNTNGDRDYSNVVSRIYTTSFGYSIAPNPVTDAAYIQIGRPFLSDVEFRMFDISGQQVIDFKESYSNKQAVDIQIGMERVASGVYVYQLIVNGEAITGRLVKF